MKMKLVAICLSGAFLSSSVAFGVDMDPKFYVGGDVQANKYSSGKTMKNVQTEMGKMDPKSKFTPKNKAASGGLFVGSRLNDNVGVEAGYDFGAKTKSTWNHKDAAGKAQSAKLNSKTSNAYADVMGYVPVTNEVDLIGSVGVGRLSTKTTTADPSLTPAQLKSVSPGKSAKFGPRVGAGAQYKFNENIGARFMVGYQKGNEIVKNATSAKLGLFYQF